MLRTVASLCLAALIFASSVAVGSARGQMPPAGAIAICAGHEVTLILVDANGEEVEVTAICPDCALSLHVPLPDRAAPAPAHAAFFLSAWSRKGIVTPGSPASVRPAARAPPSFS